MTTGIYFLKNDDEIVYIGKSKQCEKRIITHMRIGEKVFDSFEIKECPKVKLSRKRIYY